jgi:hypothetical protein
MIITSNSCSDSQVRNKLAKVETKLKRLKDAKNKEATKKKETIKDMVARWNKDDHGCSNGGSMEQG